MPGLLKAYLFFVTFYLILFSSLLANAETPSIEVNVTGTGPTYEEAKADTVKKALQLALKQLVIVDRIVSEDEVIRDRVLSTSNGYVEKYNELAVSKSKLGISVDANITVSASRIENFLGIIAGGGGEVDGSLLGEEIQRRIAQNAAVRAQSKARGEILNRLFEDFPMNAVNLKLKKISLSKKNPKIIVLELEQSFKPNFIRALDETLRALSIKVCGGPDIKRIDRFFSRVNKNALCPYNDQKKQKEFLTKHLPPSYDSKIYFGQSCIAYKNPLRTKCYLLDHGDYLNKKSLNKGRLKIIGRFIDKSGQNSLVKSPYLLIDTGSKITKKTLGVDINSGGTSLGYKKKAYIRKSVVLSTGILNLKIEIDSSKINLNTANKFVGIVALANKEGVIGLTSKKKPMPPSIVADEAVRIYLLSEN